MKTPLQFLSPWISRVARENFKSNYSTSTTQVLWGPLLLHPYETKGVVLNSYMHYPRPFAILTCCISKNEWSYRWSNVIPLIKRSPLVIDHDTSPPWQMNHLTGFMVFLSLKPYMSTKSSNLAIKQAKSDLPFVKKMEANYKRIS